MDNNTEFKKKIFSGVIWRFLERCGAQLVSFVVSIVLARMLMPEEYGVIAILLVFIELMQVFVDCGFGNALVQKKNADEIDFSTVFYFNIVMCLIIYAILFVSAPAVAWFYKNSQFAILLRVLGLLVIVSGVKSIQQAYVSKHMLFKRFFFSTLIGTCLAAIVGIYLAVIGAGVWALVIQQLVNVCVDTIVLWITVKWRPTRDFSLKRLKELFAYGSKFLFSSLLDTGCRNLRQLIIGKMYNSSSLAYYNKGNNWPNLIAANINTAIDSVLLPAMSVKQDQVDELKNLTKKSLKMSCYVVFPLMMGLFSVAKPLTTILLTDKWLPSVVYMRIFCVSYMFYPIHTTNLNAIKAIGRSDLFLKLEIIKKVVSITALLFSMRYGVLCIAVTALGVDILSSYINAYYNKKLINYSYWEQLRDISDSLIVSFVMCIIVSIEKYMIKNSIILLIFQIATGVIIYVAGSVMLKIESFTYLTNVIKGRKF